MEASRGRCASWAWVSLIQSRKILCTGVRWQVFNGASINFWDDKWIPSLPGFTISSPKPPISRVNTVVDAIDATHGLWKVATLQGLVSEAEVQAICSIPISLAHQEDTQIWHYKKSGAYTVKSGYHVAGKLEHNPKGQLPSTSFQLPRDFWHFVWSLKAPPKIRHFWWRVCKNALATEENLYRRKCSPSSTCPICMHDVESTEHLLFGCGWVRAVWFGCDLNYRVDWPSISSIPQWVCAVRLSFHHKEDCIKFFSSVAWISWFVWKERNAFVFTSTPVDPLSTIQGAQWAQAEFLHATKSSIPMSRTSSSHLPPNSDWNPPPSGSFQINCDVATLTGSDKASIAAVLRDSQGNILDGLTRKVSIASVLQGEALACRLACQLAFSLNLSGVQIASDNKSVIHLSVSETVPPWECAAVIADIKLMAQAGEFLFQWRPRTANKVAHWVAHLHLQNSLPLDWVSNPPPGLVACLASV